MDVKIDEAGHQKLPRPIDFFDSSRNGHIRAVPNSPNAGSGHDNDGIGKRRPARAVNQYRSDNGFLD
jgi:hypothetical protein